MLQSKIPSKILQRLSIQNSHSYEHLNSTDTLITVHVICPTAELPVVRGSPGFDLKIWHGHTKEI